MEEIEYINSKCAVGGIPLVLDKVHDFEVNCNTINPFATLLPKPPTTLSEGMQRLNDGLINNGGNVVCLPGFEEDLDKILLRGQFWTSIDAELSKGRQSACHENSSLLWEANQNKLYIATGYALSNDGFWVQHSWCIQESENGHPIVIETTEPRELYFGFVMTLSETERFGYDNTEFGLEVKEKTKLRYGYSKDKKLKAKI